MINQAQLRRQLDELNLAFATALSVNDVDLAQVIQNEITVLQAPRAAAVFRGGDEDARIAQQLQREEEDRLAAERLQRQLRHNQENARAEEEELTRRFLEAEAAFGSDVKNNKEEAASLALIQQLQAQDAARGGQVVRNRRPISENLEACLQFLYDPAFQALMQTPAVQGERDALGNVIITDAHKFTRTFIRDGLPTLVKIDDALKLSDPNLSVDTVLKEVLDFVATLRERDRPNVANIQKSLDLIPRGAPIEAAETNAHIPQLLSRVWSLAKLYGREHMEQIAQILHLNIEDEGKCMPGLVARLYSPFARILEDILKRSVTKAQNRPRMHR